MTVIRRKAHGIGAFASLGAYALIAAIAIAAGVRRGIAADHIGRGGIGRDVFQRLNRGQKDIEPDIQGGLENTNTLTGTHVHTAGFKTGGAFLCGGNQAGILHRAVQGGTGADIVKKATAWVDKPKRSRAPVGAIAPRAQQNAFTDVII